MSTFDERLIQAIQLKNSAACVGLDPDLALMPKWFTEPYDEDVTSLICDYNQIVIDSVADLVPIVKPQSAFYERFGVRGILALQKTIEYARKKGLLVLTDVKRGDIGSTSKAYAEAYLGGAESCLKSDAMTLIPYLGPDGMEPFVQVAQREGGGLFVCAMTSNPGAPVLQQLIADGKPIYLHVADMVRSFYPGTIGSTGYSSVGIVSGATFPEEAQKLRMALPNSFFLVPGMGAQGGSTETLTSFFDKDGLGAIVSSSRAIMYPGKPNHREELSAAIRAETIQFNLAINSARLVTATA